MKNNSSHILFRKPEISDAYSIWKLIKESPPLDLNSLYCYLIICTHFVDTSIIAEDSDGICGFISAYIRPDSENILFVWQVVVKKEKKRQGIANTMLQSLLRRKHKKVIQYLETTVNPSNKASGALFYAIAKSLNTKCHESVFFTEKDFGNQAHEDEILYRIGPFDIT